MSNKNVKYPEIRKSLNEREQTSRSKYRKSIHESKGMDRWWAWVAKREYGTDTRHLLLAYAMLRGLPYSVCERNAEIRPSALAIRVTAKEYGHMLTEDAIHAWINGESEPAQVPVPAPVQTVPEPTPPPTKPGLFKRLFGGSHA
jgi:hypothetical protein